MKKKDKNRAAEVKARIDKIRQRMKDAELNGDTDYFTKKNEHGETQADIDNFFRETIKNNPNGFGGKGFFVERHEEK